jgi:hypothetical protein
MGFGDRRHAPNLGDSVAGEVGTNYVHRVGSQQVLKHSRVSREAPETDGSHAFRGYAGGGDRIRQRARLIKPEEMKAFERSRQSGGVARRQATDGIEDKITPFSRGGAHRIQTLPRGTHQRFAVVAGFGGRSGNEKGPVSGGARLPDVCGDLFVRSAFDAGKCPRLVPGGSAEYLVDRGFRELPYHVEHGHIETGKRRG